MAGCFYQFTLEIGLSLRLELSTIHGHPLQIYKVSAQRSISLLFLHKDF